jgi:hypothetical protein
LASMDVRQTGRRCAAEQFGPILAWGRP